MNVVNTCTVTGTTVNLGTFRTTDTLQTVGNKIGYQDGETYELVAGTDGVGTVSMGSVTCDSGTSYTLTMESTGWYGSMDIQMHAGILELYPMVSKIGDTVITDGTTGFNGFGKWPSPQTLAIYTDQSPVGTIATGAPQEIKGNVIAWVAPTYSNGYMGGDQELGTPGVYTGTWTTTLYF